MPECLHSRLADAREVPWRNGRGVTRELALWPAAASFERGDFDWRISRAALDAPGPFSAFPGFERILVVTGGAGLVLVHGASAPRARLRALEPYRFSGDWPTAAELVSGAVGDFNVVFRRGAVAAQVEALALGARRTRAALEAGHAFAHVLAGEVGARATDEEQPFALQPGDSLWLRGLRGGEELELTGASRECSLLLVRLAGAG